ncbi:DNA photolyase [Gammaproteobacteria bacterium]|nr:DNA photolyase [Gammaproteobacteria bacterium]
MYKKAIEDKSNFIQNGLKDYSSQRNYDFGPKSRENTSILSKYISHRIINEYDLVREILSQYNLQKVDKFIQEVFWRVYWKGWLEHRSEVWRDFVDSDPTYSEEKYKKAINGETGIECFDDWVKELKTENYLHNHTRMWFASIWIFTLNLPWELGARFFMKHLFDGDAASNTLSWRWVAGIQTQGKNYLARESNIRKFTNQRYTNTSLNENALPLENPKIYPLQEVRHLHTKQKYKNLVLFETDLNVKERYSFFENYDNIYLVLLDNKNRNIKLDEKVLNFKRTLQEAFTNEISNSQIIDEDTFMSFNAQFDVLYPSIGENMDFLVREFNDIDKLHFIGLKEDIYCWQFSKKGFFNFKKNIPEVINYLLHENDLFN